MTPNVASLNARGLRDPSKCACLLGELSNPCMDVAAVQENRFTCTGHCRVLEDGFVTFSAFGTYCSAGFSLLVGRSLHTIVNLIFADDRGQLVVADVAVKRFEFWLVAVYAPNSIGERSSFSRQLEPFLDDSKWLVLMGDWNIILDSMIDKGGRGVSGLGRYDSSLSDVLVEFDLIDMFLLDHPGGEMWSWLRDSPSGQIRYNLDKV